VSDSKSRMLLKTIVAATSPWVRIPRPPLPDQALHRQGRLPTRTLPTGRRRYVTRMRTRGHQVGNRTADEVAGRASTGRGARSTRRMPEDHSDPRGGLDHTAAEAQSVRSDQDRPRLAEIPTCVMPRRSGTGGGSSSIPGRPGRH
jgi:hypothetical protein